MDLLSSTIFNGIMFPTQLAACFIHFFCPLSIDLPLYSPGEMEQVTDLTPVLSPSPVPIHALHNWDFFLASLYSLKACLT